jgi:hypothetical protein
VRIGALLLAVCRVRRQQVQHRLGVRCCGLRRGASEIDFKISAVSSGCAPTTEAARCATEKAVEADGRRELSQ